MAKKRVKKRTHAGAQPAPPGAVAPKTLKGKTPKSMVIRVGAGDVGSSVTQLVKDVRSMMEPETASRLKERRGNRLRDYTTMAGPLGVTHLLLFSRSSTGNINMRLALTPRGPTLHFHVETYSLCKDVMKALKHPKGGGREYKTPPLLLMNHFTSPAPVPAPADGQTAAAGIPKHVESLTTTIFRSLFPEISAQATPLSSIQRVMLLNRELPKAAAASKSTSNTEGKPPSATGGDGKGKDDASFLLNLRHYAITTKRTGLSRGIRRINAAEKLLGSSSASASASAAARLGNKRGGLPNLGRLEDVADYLLDPSSAVGGGNGGPASAGGFTSGSESEPETDAEVEVLQPGSRRVLTRKQYEKAVASEDKGASVLGRGGSSAAAAGRLEKRAVRLVELGPRMSLRLVKIEEGVCEGKVMWHEFRSRTRQEERELDAVWDKRRLEKEERRRVQKENVDRKRKEKRQNKGGAEGGKEDEEEEDDDDVWDDDDFDEEDLDNADDMEVDGGIKVPAG